VPILRALAASALPFEFGYNAAEGKRMHEITMKVAAGVDGAAEPYWRTKGLAEMDSGEWEALCDGCARCCLNKLEEEDSGDIFWTNVACTLLDGESCRCRDYEGRHTLVPDCVRLTPDNVTELAWLPPTCAYRLIAEGRDLYWWHPLVSGDPESVHQAGISVRGRTVSEDGIAPEELEDFIVDWPGENVTGEQEW
jgi:uncharacterized cysteine cluster protein YcgN (CxxCxxCC family)